MLLGVGFLAINSGCFCSSSGSAPACVRAVHLAGPRPPFYTLFLAVGRAAQLADHLQADVLRLHPARVFGESMMLVYYGYALPLSLRIGRGFTRTGSGPKRGSCRTHASAGMTWREGEADNPGPHVPDAQLRAPARRARRATTAPPAALLRDKIAAHDIHFTGKTLDLGMHDERDDV